MSKRSGRTSLSYTTSELICPECGGVVPIPRRRGSQRERGHIKDFWCPYCRKEVKMKEKQFNNWESY